MNARHLILAAALLLLAADARPQSPRLAGRGPGRSLAGVGDLDGDGIGDLVGAARGITSGFFFPGAVYAVSGRDGQVLYSFDKHTPIGITTAYPTVSACGDVDGDGVPDFAISAFGVALVSGADGTLIRAYPTSVFAGVGDVNGDGRGDLAIVDPYSPVVHYVRVYSGADSEQLVAFPFNVSYPLLTQIIELLGVGDVDGDGHPDVAVLSTAMAGVSVRVLRVFSSATGKRLFERFDLPISAGGGTALANVGDLTGDGRAELVAATGTPGQPGVLLSGRNGATIHAYLDPQLTYGASSVVSPGDIDRDGVADLVFGAPYGGALPKNHGRVTAISGRLGNILWSSVGPDPVYGLGTGLAVLGDTDGDGLDDVAAGATRSTSGLIGANGYVIFSSRPKPTEVTGKVFDKVSTLSFVGSLLPDSIVSARIANGTPGGTMLVSVGPTLLEPSPLLGVEALPFGGIVFPVVLNAEGRAEIHARWPAGVPSGLTLYVIALETPGWQYEDSNLVRLVAP